MRALTLLSIVLATGDGSPPADSHDTLYGIIFTGSVTLVLGILTLIGTRNRRAVDTSPPQPAPIPVPVGPPIIDDEVIDLRNQRDAVQRKLDSLRARTEERLNADRTEIARLRDLLWKNHIDPVTGKRTDEPSP